MIFLKVPFDEKDEAKSLGASWNREKKSWYIDDNINTKRFERWIVAADPIISDNQINNEVSEFIPGNARDNNIEIEYIDLYVDLIPKLAIYPNLHNELTITEWNHLKNKTFKASKNYCQACGGQGSKWPVECHERWYFDDETYTQTLLGTVSLCPSCHEATHYNLACMKHRELEAKQQLRDVTGWVLPRVEMHVKEATRIWKKRKSTEWILQAKWLSEFIDLSTISKVKFGIKA